MDKDDDLNKGNESKISISKTTTKKDTYNSYTRDELDEMLKLAIKNEDYEKASVLKDEIEKRDKKSNI